MLFDPKVAPLKAAIQLDALGFLPRADHLYQEVIAANGDDAEQAKILRRKMHKRFELRNGEAPDWSFLSTSAPEEGGFETNFFSKVKYKHYTHDSISEVTSDVIFKPEDFGEQSVYIAKLLFYKSRRLVILTGDEWYGEGEQGFYRYADVFIRPYYSHFLKNDRSVIQVPLGWRGTEYAEWPKDAPRKTVFNRGYLWSFVGEPDKSTRPAMLAAMRTVGFGFEHLACGYHSGDKLSSREYRRIMEETIFAPCPAGWANLESFRVWEALEAGCIPIVEKRAGFDYFTSLAGPHPMLALEDWNDVPALLTALGGAEEIEALRLACQSWWSLYKDRLADQVAAALA